MARAASKSQEVRSKLGHPVVDADGHLQELVPVLKDYVLDRLREIGGASMVDQFERAGLTYRTSVADRWMGMTWEERRRTWTSVPAWWGQPSKNTRDRAAASFPGLLAERMDELGIDFAVMYPSHASNLPDLADPDLRRAAVRAYNSFYAELYRPYADRLTPAALMPMDTPEEAVDELEYAVGELGLKAIMVRPVKRPIPDIAERDPDLAMRAYRLDMFGIDSPYDYDPLWRRCVELKTAVASHAGAQGWGSRRSVSRFVYNHIGSFAEGSEALCKSLFMGGVTKRFPGLNFGFLEGGAAWACALYADFIGHWEKRNEQHLLEHLDPAARDHAGFRRYLETYGDDRAKRAAERIDAFFREPEPHPDELDDLSACGIEKPEDIRDLFVPNFFFGCEADDPLTTWAFNTKVNPFGARLGAMFSSDFGHWDVPDMREVLAEAYEAVEKGLLTEDDFRDFSFVNPVRFWGEVNPNFFEGTRVEAEAVRVLAESKQPARA